MENTITDKVIEKIKEQMMESEKYGETVAYGYLSEVLTFIQDLMKEQNSVSDN